jgi:bacterioferritin-associated ferredoxin
MYVCICNAVTDHQIREAVDNGYDSLEKLRDELKVATGCGKCESCARRLLEEIRSETAWSGIMAPAPV